MVTLILIAIIGLILLKALKIISKMFFKTASIIMAVLVIYRLSMLFTAAG